MSRWRRDVRRIRLTRTSLLALASSLALVTTGAGQMLPAAAQTLPEEAVNRSLSGAVTVVDAIDRTFTVREAEGPETTFVVTEETTLLDGSRPIRLEDLREADRVVVDADDRHGRNVAVYVEVVQDDPQGVRRSPPGPPAP